ncbi:MAG TPA: type II toxin-antitoxin system MqsA family antitoxin [Candidatus Acidoferrum sp.]|nr:type II toxin-antitoxin system MqsA family antitoxin [Candidatus Acidoferrum sp.]
MSAPGSVCPLCGGHKAPGTATFTADIGTGVVVVRHVCATVCAQCGEEWIDNETARKIESIVEDARAKKRQVEVADLAA